jgi:hypothetical protein
VVRIQRSRTDSDGSAKLREDPHSRQAPDTRPGQYPSRR